ncbi:uncharacterized protein E0L32_011847 [Thyridium curvatum]|uniref:VOC domain-containing protein n=1 Tax=Thyridium curvatum TaxID=1093900 RepID=A0A507BDQ3_9PEZI|nr:uncharacterized protein E0L32_011847 [Thyridium curvatum]TPX18077.1 hypothetical protein E0L32_011847 [Thyridium curvatum]
MPDIATPNLPSRDFTTTSAFYRKLGFAETFRDEGWMILKRPSTSTGTGLTLEFFPHPELDPAASWFSCCLRLDDVDAFFAEVLAAGVPEATVGFPRAHRPQGGDGDGGGALLDPDGTLLRLLKSQPAA